MCGNGQQVTAAERDDLKVVVRRIIVLWDAAASRQERPEPQSKRQKQ